MSAVPVAVTVNVACLIWPSEVRWTLATVNCRRSPPLLADCSALTRP